MNERPEDLKKEEGDHTSRLVIGAGQISKKYPAYKGMQVLNYTLDGIIVDSNEDVACKKGCAFCCFNEVEGKKCIEAVTGK